MIKPGQYTEEEAEKLLGFKVGELVKEKYSNRFAIVKGLGYEKTGYLNNGGCVLIEYIDHDNTRDCKFDGKEIMGYVMRLILRIKEKE
mgnify:CR=1 FL=1